MQRVNITACLLSRIAISLFWWGVRLPFRVATVITVARSWLRFKGSSWGQVRWLPQHFDGRPIRVVKFDLFGCQTTNIQGVAAFIAKGKRIQELSGPCLIREQVTSQQSPLLAARLAPFFSHTFQMQCANTLSRHNVSWSSHLARTYGDKSTRLHLFPSINPMFAV